MKTRSRREWERCIKETERHHYGIRSSDIIERDREVHTSSGTVPSQESRQAKSDYDENPAATKPKAVITGDSQAQGIAKFAHRMTYEDLAPEQRERLKVSVLDSLGCAISALGVPPIAACLEQAMPYGDGSDVTCSSIPDARYSGGKGTRLTLSPLMIPPSKKLPVNLKSAWRDYVAQSKNPETPTQSNSR